MTEQNLRSTFDHSKKLLHAKDIQEAIQIQTEFLKAQHAAASEQLKKWAAAFVRPLKAFRKPELQSSRSLGTSA